MADNNGFNKDRSRNGNYNNRGGNGNYSDRSRNGNYSDRGGNSNFSDRGGNGNFNNRGGNSNFSDRGGNGNFNNRGGNSNFSDRGGNGNFNNRGGNSNFSDRSRNGNFNDRVGNTGSRDNTKVVAPYNFVPFPDKVLIRYENAKDLPRHDKIEPALKTGEIHVTFTAKAPISISDGKGRFFRNAAGQYAIPGSTVKGLIRETMQILGQGLVRPGEDLDDELIYFRNIAGKKTASNAKAKEYYYKVLNIPTPNPLDRTSTDSVPQAVDAGFLVREGRRYFIVRAERYYRIGRTLESMDRLPLLRGLMNATSQELPVLFCLDDAGEISALERQSGRDVPAGMKRGSLLITGRVPKGKNAVYLIPEPERAQRIPLSDNDILFYQTDYERRMNVLRPREFWALPKNGERKAVFFLRNAAKRETYFGRTLYLRIGYPHSVGFGLPKVHGSLCKKEAVALDYPHAVLGFASEKSAYRSRVSFEDLTVQAPHRDPQRHAVVLAGPKPSFAAGYLLGEKVSYVDNNFTLRGFKQYWLQQQISANASDKENVNSTIEPLPAGTRFSGVIRYKNLHEDELGLLLWSLLADGRHCHNIGGAKPYGFGRVSVTIDALREWDSDSLYSADNLCAVPRTGDSAQYIEAFQTYAARELELVPGQRVEDLPQVKDFLFMKSTITANPREVRYMELKEYSNTSGTLKTAAEYRTLGFGQADKP